MTNELAFTISWLLGMAALVLSILTILQYNSVLKSLKGGEGWVLYRFGFLSLMISLIFYLLGPISQGLTQTLYILGNLCIMVGCLIFVIALVKIYSAIERVRR